MTGSMRLVVKVDAPTDASEWDLLAEANGNLVQSTAFDGVQSYYRMQPVYFEARSDDRLMGGVRVYRWQARRMRALTASFSQQITQFGELLRPRTADATLEEVVASLQIALRDYLRTNAVVSVRTTGLYGDGQLLLDPGPAARWRQNYSVAWLDLERPLADAWRAVHEKHRSWIRKAERLRVTVAEEDDVETLLALLRESYEGQHRVGPNPAYVRHAYASLRKAGRATLFVARSGDEPLAAAMVHRFGRVAYYDFGGVRRDRTGAGHLLHWHIAARLREGGVARYVLGQVASPEGHHDARFAEGISRFKRSFGTREDASHAALFVMRPLRHVLWKAVTRWMN